MSLEAPGILLVEDDDNDLFLMQRALHKAGVEAAQVAVARDGEAAQSLLERCTVLPRLVVLDLKLPRKSGLEVLEWLSSWRAVRPVVVVLTSSREPRDVARAYERGANSYLVKPGDFQGLSELVSALVRYWLELNVAPDLAVVVPPE